MAKADNVIFCVKRSAITRLESPIVNLLTRHQKHDIVPVLATVEALHHVPTVLLARHCCHVHLCNRINTYIGPAALCGSRKTSTRNVSLTVCSIALH
jgi:hypothetical protein